jgi:hypothetical protein
MKKFIYVVPALIGLYFLISVLTKIISDFGRLTNYGIGFIVGQSILFLLFLFISIQLKHKM